MQFQPSNLEAPLIVIYKSHLYKLESYTHKIDKLYLQEHILSDNKHLILNKNFNSYNLGMSTLYGNNYFCPKDFDSINNINNKSSCIYSLDIFMDYEIIYYTREYKKLLLIISNVFPLFRFVSYLIKCFTQHIKMSIIKSRLVGLIFENRTIQKTNIFKYRRLNQLIDGKNKSKYLSVNDGSNELIFSKNNEPPPSENISIFSPNDKDKKKY